MAQATSTATALQPGLYDGTLPLPPEMTVPGEYLVLADEASLQLAASNLQGATGSAVSLSAPLLTMASELSTTDPTSSSLTSATASAEWRVVSTDPQVATDLVRTTLSNTAGVLAVEPNHWVYTYRPSVIRRDDPGTTKDNPETKQSTEPTVGASTGSSAASPCLLTRAPTNDSFLTDLNTWDPANTIGLLWGHHRTCTTEAWSLFAPTVAGQPLPGQNVVVAVIDTGVDYNHPELRNKIWINPGEDQPPLGVVDADDFNGIDNDGNGLIDDVRGYDFVDNASPVTGDGIVGRDNDPNDTDQGGRHGTWVAGLIAAQGGNDTAGLTLTNELGMVGVAYAAKIMALRAFEFDSRVTPGLNRAKESDLIAAVNYAMAKGAKIINMSWGQGVQMPALSAALDQAAASGIVLVAAAGNNAQDARLVSPAGHKDVIAVGAVQQALVNSAEAVAAFSNTGPKIDLVAPGGDILETQAVAGNANPGLNIVSVQPSVTDTTSTHALPENVVKTASQVTACADTSSPCTAAYRRTGGTSGAAAYVSGVAAMILSRDPTFTPEMVRAVLRSSATDIEATGVDAKSGYGRLNTEQAVQIALPLGVKVTQPAPMTLVMTSPVSVAGEIALPAGGSVSGTIALEVGEGEFPTPASWRSVAVNVDASNRVTATLDPTNPVVFPTDNQRYTLRLRAVNNAGQTFEARVPLLLSKTVTTQAISGGPILTSPIVIDLDPNAVPLNGKEIIAGSWDGSVYVWDAQGNPKAGWPQLTMGNDIFAAGPIVASPAVADLDPTANNGLEVVALAGHAVACPQWIHVWRADSTSFSGAWPQALQPCIAGSQPFRIASPTLPSPVLADLNGDAIPEILIGSTYEKSGFNPAGLGVVRAYRADGSLFREYRVNGLDGGSFSAGNQFAYAGCCAVGNLDADANLEIVSGFAGITVTGITKELDPLRHDGKLAVWDVGSATPQQSWLLTGSALTIPSVFNFDGDTALEIAYLGRPGPTEPAKANLMVFDTATGTGPVFSRTVDADLGATGTALADNLENQSPVVADLEGDGSLEVVYTAKSSLGSASLFAVHVTGGAGLCVDPVQVPPCTVIGYPIALGTQQARSASPSVANVDTEGTQEVLVSGDQGLLYGLRTDGEVLPAYPKLVGFHSLASPAIADLDGNAQQELEVVTGASDGRIYAYSDATGLATATAPWPTYRRDAAHTGRYQGQSAPTQNRRPVLRPISPMTGCTAPATHCIAGGQTLTINLSANEYDPAPQVVTFDAASKPTGLTFTSGAREPNGVEFKGQLTWTPACSQRGQYPLTVKASDNGTPSLSDQEAIIIEVTCPNQPPDIFDFPGIIEVCPGTTRTEQAKIREPDGDPIANCQSLPIFNFPSFINLSLVSVTDPDPLVRFACEARIECDLSVGCEPGDYTGLQVKTCDSPQAGGSLCDTTAPFTVRALDVTDPQCFTNSPPSFTSQPANQSLAEGQTKTLNLAPLALDPDGDPLTFTKTSGPTWATVDSQTGIVTMSPGFLDGNIPDRQYTVSVQVTDPFNPPGPNSTAAFTVFVANVNRNPVLAQPPDKATSENVAVTVDLSATDEDCDRPGNLGTFAFSRVSIVPAPPSGTLPAVVTTDSTFDLCPQPGPAPPATGTGRLTWTPGFTDGSIAGTVYTVTVKVEDGQAPILGVNSKTFKITVSDVNRNPVINPLIPDTTVAENTSTNLPVAATDPDPGDIVTCALSNNPTFVRIDSATCLITITPGFLDGGEPNRSYPNIRVTASDNRGGSVFDEFNLSVTNVNRNPSLFVPAGPVFVQEGRLLDQVLTASDKDSDRPGNLGVFTFSLVSITPSDPLSNPNPANRPSVVCVSCAFTPPPADAVGSGAFRWTPDFDDGAAYPPGRPYDVVAKVDDGQGGSATSPPFRVIVVRNTNPSFDPLGGPYTVQEGQKLVVHMIASDPDTVVPGLFTFSHLDFAPDPLSGDPGSVFVRPLDASINDGVGTGDWEWTPGFNDGSQGTGTPYTVTVKVEDGQGGFATGQFSVNVTEVNPCATDTVRPTIELVLPAGSPRLFNDPLSANQTAPSAVVSASPTGITWIVRDNCGLDPNGGQTIARHDGSGPTNLIQGGNLTELTEAATIGVLLPPNTAPVDPLYNSTGSANRYTITARDLNGNVKTVTIYITLTSQPGEPGKAFIVPADFAFVQLSATTAGGSTFLLPWAPTNFNALTTTGTVNSVAPMDGGDNPQPVMVPSYDDDGDGQFDDTLATPNEMIVLVSPNSSLHHDSWDNDSDVSYDYFAFPALFNGTTSWHAVGRANDGADGIDSGSSCTKWKDICIGGHCSSVCVSGSTVQRVNAFTMAVRPAQDPQWATQIAIRTGTIRRSDANLLIPLPDGGGGGYDPFPAAGQPEQSFWPDGPDADAAPDPLTRSQSQWFIGLRQLAYYDSDSSATENGDQAEDFSLATDAVGNVREAQKIQVDPATGQLQLVSGSGANLLIADNTNDITISYFIIATRRVPAPPLLPAGTTTPRQAVRVSTNFAPVAHGAAIPLTTPSSERWADGSPVTYAQSALWVSPSHAQGRDGTGSNAGGTEDWQFYADPVTGVVTAHVHDGRNGMADGDYDGSATFLALSLKPPAAGVAAVSEVKIGAPGIAGYPWAVGDQMSYSTRWAPIIANAYAGYYDFDFVTFQGRFVSLDPIDPWVDYTVSPIVEQGIYQIAPDCSTDYYGIEEGSPITIDVYVDEDGTDPLTVTATLPKFGAVTLDDGSTSPYGFAGMEERTLSRNAVCSDNVGYDCYTASTGNTPQVGSYQYYAIPVTVRENKAKGYNKTSHTSYTGHATVVPQQIWESCRGNPPPGGSDGNGGKVINTGN
ncbi:MAG: S8 family serine peptidase [Candidatus Omnitrophica bacterium]|nr:S8 family serine peptidase [Candidatus Omnitrophota bacterium]